MVSKLYSERGLAGPAPKSDLIAVTLDDERPILLTRHVASELQQQLCIAILTPPQSGRIMPLRNA